MENVEKLQPGINGRDKIQLRRSFGLIQGVAVIVGLVIGELLKDLFVLQSKQCFLADSEEYFFLSPKHGGK